MKQGKNAPSVQHAPPDSFFWSDQDLENFQEAEKNGL